MNKKLAILAERRRQLTEQAASQRAALVAHIEPWRTPLALADSGLAAIHYVKRHPVLMIGAVAFLAVLRRYPGGKWLQRGWAMYELGRKFGPLFFNTKNK